MTAPAASSASVSAHEDLLARLAGSGLLEECQALPRNESEDWWRDREVAHAVSGRLRVGDRSIPVYVGLPRSFPLCLPEIAVASGDADTVDLPHVNDHRKLCYEPEAGLLLDRKDPWAILQESVGLARSRLHEILRGERAAEFAQEILAYWRQFTDKRKTDCVVSPSDAPHRTVVLFEKSDFKAVADEPETYLRSLPARRTDGLSHRNAVYIPIDPAAVDHAFVPRELTTLAGLRKYVRALSGSTGRDLAKILARCDKREEFVVLGVRRPSGDRALLGINLLRKAPGAHPLANDGTDAQVQPVALVRRDRAFLAPRGGAGPDLAERRILLVGCGAVGGYIAVALARAGIGTLTLVDFDLFELENTYRHVCGMAWRGWRKVQGLKQELERLVPYVHVNTHQGKLERLLVESPELVGQHDLVISAIGNPTIELMLNERIWSDRSGPPAIFAWLEPLGLGGHVLLTHTPGGQPARGCLECLIDRRVEGGPLENRAAFARPGVTYTRDVLGCGSRYLPFGDLDAQRTAEIATRLALDSLRGRAEGCPLTSWKGDDGDFLAAGFSVTARYLGMAAGVDTDRSSYIREACPVCAT
jgi:molybdopterin/thiamine biosynthesis adenylyltransferase